MRSPRGGNKPTALLYGTSVLDVRLELPRLQDIETRDGLRIMSLPIACSVTVHRTSLSGTRSEMRVPALAMVEDASDVLAHLLAGGHSKVAGRLAGAFRNIGRDQIADDIVGTMRTAGYIVNESDPFDSKPSISFRDSATSPYVNRLRLMWERMRPTSWKISPPRPAGCRTKPHTSSTLKKSTQPDAYNSLSIEGYRVSAALIERVRSGKWNPDSVAGDRGLSGCVGRAWLLASFPESEAKHR